MKRVEDFMQGLAWGLILMAVIIAAFILLSGCQGLRSALRGKAGRDVVQTTEQKQQESTVEVETARDVVATYHALDEQRRKLEEARLRDRRIAEGQMGLMVAGVMLVFLAAKALGPIWLRPFIWIAGVSAIIAGWILPLFIGLFKGG